MASRTCLTQRVNPERPFRGDATFASPDIHEFLEAEDFLYAIRLPKNQILQESIAHLLSRPVGRPPNHVRRYHASFSYQAGGWSTKRRVVPKSLPLRRRGSNGIPANCIPAWALIRFAAQA